MFPPPGANPPPILEYLISPATKGPERANDKNRDFFYCRSISTRGGDSTEQGEVINVEATKTSGGREGEARPS